jgi:hypothetical protein
MHSQVNQSRIFEFVKILFFLDFIYIYKLGYKIRINKLT